MVHEVREFTLLEAKEYLREKGKVRGRFYFNIYGWRSYFTLEPTFATPTGKLKGYPRTKMVTLFM